MKNIVDFMQANLLIKNGRPEEAEKVLRELHRLEPCNSVIANTLTRMLIINKKISIDQIQLLQSLAKSDDLAKLHIGNLAFSVGDKKCAKYYFYQVKDADLKKAAMYELGKIEFSEKKYDKARAIFEKLLRYDNLENVRIQLILLEIRENNFRKAYEMLKEVSKKNFSINDIRLFLNYNAGLIDMNSEEFKKNYYLKQYLNYSKEEAIEHIKLHLDEDNTKKRHSIFKKNINIESFFNKARIKIQDINPNSMSLADHYILSHKTITGSFEGKDTYGLGVVTIFNTDKILTMYPYPNIEKEKVIHK